MADEPKDALLAIAARRTRVAIVVTVVTMFTYFGFILLVAFEPALAEILTPGLSVGIVLGAVVIVIAWALTGIYVLWANRRYDRALDAYRGGIR
jgi:uncharacterized membrane protein (DUF485 family)